jgi:arylsulfatase A-like enzyme
VQQLVSTSPATAILEISKMIFLMTGCFILLLCNHRWVAQHGKIRKEFLALWTFGIACIPFFYFTLSYPALFTANWSPSLQSALLFVAKFLSPSIILWAGIYFWLSAWVWLLVSKRGALYGLILMLLPIAVYLAALSIPAIAWTKSTKPKILLIAIDSLRKDHLDPQYLPGVFQHLMKDTHTVSFDNHHVGLPRTFPSWTEIFTGTYAPENGIRHMFPSHMAKNVEFMTLPKRLKEIGYQSIVLSDFAGDIFPRIPLGFDRIIAPTLNMKTVIRSGIYSKNLFTLPFLLASPRSWFPDLLTLPAYAEPKNLTKQILAVLEPEQMQFITLFFSTAHFPYASPHPDYLTYTDSSYRGPHRFLKNPSIYRGGEKTEEPDIQQIKALYRGSLRSIDRSLETFFQTLKDEGTWDESTILLTADHGEELFDRAKRHGHGEHLFGSYVTQVPWVLKLPNTLPTPSVKNIPEVSRSIDIGSTIIAIAAANIPEPSIQSALGSGHNWLNYLAQPNQISPNLTAYSETGIWFSQSDGGFYQDDRLTYPGVSQLLQYGVGREQEIVLNPIFENVLVAAKHRALVYGPWKLIYQPGKNQVHWYLYDQSSDPDNLQNLAESHPTELSDMKKLFWLEISRLEPASRIADEYIVKP